MTNTLKLSNTDAAVLGALIVEAGTFAGTDTSRPILNAVLFARTDDGMLRMVATDSYALGIFDTTTAVEDGFGSLIELAGLTAIGKALAKLRAQQPGVLGVTFTFDEKQLRVETADWALNARVVFGTFPAWEQLLPQPQEELQPYPAVDAAKLLRFCKLTLACPMKKGLPGLALKTTSNGTLKPLGIDASTEHCTFRGLLMPIRLYV